MWHPGMPSPVVFVASNEPPRDDNGAHPEKENAEARPRLKAEPRAMLEMPQTTREHYVTGITVMSLRHRSIGMGGSWRREIWGPPGATALTSGHRAFSKAAPITAKAMGNTEIVDLRPALIDAGHRAGGRDEPVWGATHVRATLELAWETLHHIVHGGIATSLCWTYDERTMRVWLSKTERGRAAELGRKMARVADDLDVSPWNEWLDSLA